MGYFRTRSRHSKLTVMQGVLHGMTYWRNRAQEARELAEQLTTAEARRIMLDIAESYENLAEGVQQHSGSSRPRPGRDQSPAQ